jgi:transcriptional regulator EpsA
MRDDAVDEGQWSLEAGDNATLVSSIVAAAQIRRRFQFFAWTQAQLQEVLPHNVLVCGVARSNGTSMFFDHFYNTPFPRATLARLCHPREGIVAELTENWRAQGCEPMLVTRGDGFDPVTKLGNELHGLQLGDAVLHGIPNEHHVSGAYAVVAAVSLPRAPGPRELHLLQALVPSIFGAYCRALARDEQPIAAGAASSGPDSELSDRETEILRWVRDGKSNQEIGAILSISPLTVKNHMQRILRKLQASNRTQAVSKAMSMKLLGGSSARVEKADPIRSSA